MNNKRSISVFSVTFFVVFLFFLMIRSSVADNNFCWKSSNGRGVGTIPTDCGPGNEYSNGICYPKCKPGFGGFGPFCTQSTCPAGFSDGGAFCNANQASYGRGAGYVIWDGNKCKSKNPQGCAVQDALWYPNCREGYKGIGPVCWADCSKAGMTGAAPSCIKNTYTRGAGNLNYNCSADKQYDAGLCYKPCAPNNDGIGPVCWGKCPANLPFNCGAGCATSESACIENVLDQTLSVINVVSNIVVAVATGGAGNAAKVTAQQAAKAIANQAKQFAKGTSKAAIKEALKKAAKDAGKDIAESVLEGWAEEMSKAAAGQEINLEALTALDPTGISDIVLAYNKGVCPVDAVQGPATGTPEVWSIGVDAVGEAWVLGRDAVPGGYPPYIFDSVGGTWKKLPGGLINIAVGPDGAWGVNSSKDIFQWVNGTWEHFSPFKANGISVGPTGEMWAVSTESTPGGFSPFRWNTGSNTWEQMPGGVTQLAVGPEETWAVNDQQDIYRWVNNNTWERVPGKAYGVGVSPQGEVWVVGTNPIPGGFSPYRFNESLGNWDKLPGGITVIAVGSKGPWAINNTGAIFRWFNNEWQFVPKLNANGGSQ